MLLLLLKSPHLGAIQEPNQSDLIRTKDDPNTLTFQEITRVLETPCQEPETAPTYMCVYTFYIYITHILYMCNLTERKIKVNYKNESSYSQRSVKRTLLNVREILVS